MDYFSGMEVDVISLYPPCGLSKSRTRSHVDPISTLFPRPNTNPPLALALNDRTSLMSSAREDWCDVIDKSKEYYAVRTVTSKSGHTLMETTRTKFSDASRIVKEVNFERCCCSRMIYEVCGYKYESEDDKHDHQYHAHREIARLLTSGWIVWVFKFDRALLMWVNVVWSVSTGMMWWIWNVDPRK